MYIVRNKTTKEVIHINPAPLEQKLKESEIYYLFDPATMEIGTTPSNRIPDHFKISKDGEIVELTLEEKIGMGIRVSLTPSQKIADNRIVSKTLSEQMAAGLITLAPTQRILIDGKDERIVDKSLSEQVAEGLIKIPPTAKIVLDEKEGERIVEKTTAEQVQEGLIQLSPNQKLEGQQIVEKTATELLKQNLLTLEEIKEKKIQYFSDLALEKRISILPDYKLQNALLDIYDDQTVANYKTTIQAFRDEFHRLEKLIEKAKTLKKIETIVENFPKEIIIAKLA